MANIADCYYQYDNNKFKTKDDLYLGVLSNMESRQSILKGANINSQAVNLTKIIFEPELPKGKNLVDANQFEFESKQPKNLIVNLKNLFDTDGVPTRVSFKFTSVANPDFVMYGVRANNKILLYTANGNRFGSATFSNKVEALAYINSKAFENYYNRLTEEEKRNVGLHTSEIQRQTIETITNNSNLLALDSTEKFYVNIETGERFDRVSSVINNNKRVTGKYVDASLAIGTGLDTLNRDIMNGQLKKYKQYTTVEGKQLFDTQDAFTQYVQEVNKFKQQLEARGEQIVTNNGQEIILFDPETGIAGAVDLITVDAQGKIRIYDYKSMRGDQLSESYAGSKVVKYDDSFNGEDSNRVKHTKQQSYYKALFEKYFKLPVESINIIHIEVDMYEPTARSIKRAEIATTTQLTPIAINLGKVRPSGTKKSFADFIKDYTVTEEDLAEAEAVLAAPENAKRFDIETPTGTHRIIFEDDDWYTGQNKVTGEYVEYTYAEVLKVVAASKAHENYLLNGINEIEQGTVNRNTPIKFNLPTTQEETDSLFTDEVPQRDPESVKHKTGIAYIDKYFKNDRLGTENIPQLLSDLTTESNRSSDKAVLAIFAGNPAAFDNVPIIIDRSLTTRGSVKINSVGQAVSVAINPDLIKSEGDAKRVLMEEMLHAVTVNELRKGGEYATRLNTLREAAIDHFGREKFETMQLQLEELNGLRRIKAQSSLSANQQATYDTLINNPEFNDIFYRLSSLDEFLVGSLISSSFQSYLNDISIDDASMTGVKSMWSKLIDIIAEFLGKYVDNSNKYKPVLKYALYDSLNIVESSMDSIRKDPGMVDVSGRHRKTIAELESMFNLRDENGNLNRIDNVEDVKDLINANVYNVVALAEQDNTITLYYKSAMQLNAPDASTDEDIDLDARARSKRDFQTRIKSYVLNLRARERSIYASLRQNEYYEGMTEAESEEAAIRSIELSKELEHVKELVKNVTKRGEVNVNNLMKLKEQALGELEHIKEFMNKGMNSADIKYALETTKFWLNAKNMMFSKNDFADAAMIEEYNDIETKASLVDKVLLEKLNDWVMTNLVKKQTNYKGSLTQMLKEMKDIGKISAEVADLGTMDSPILQALAKHIRLKDVELTKRRTDKLNEFNAVIKNAANTLKSYGSPNNRYELFRQRDEFGRPSMNLVNRFSRLYQKERKALNFVYGKSEGTKAEAYEAYRFMRTNTEIANIAVLFPENDADFNKETYDAEVARLKAIMGDGHFTQWYADQSKKIKNYKKFKLGQELYITRELKLATPEQIPQSLDASRYMSIWEERNSPYTVMAKLYKDEKANPFTLKNGYTNFKFIADIPKKQLSDKGVTKDSGYYDAGFETIERNPDLLAVYESFQDIMKYVGNIIPYESAERLAKGQVPEFQKSMYEALIDQPSNLFGAINESLVDMVRTERFEQHENEIDILTGKTKRSVRLGTLSSRENIEKEIYVERLKVFQATGEQPSVEKSAEIRSSVTAKYAEAMDFDLGQVFSKYLDLGLAYESRAEAEEVFNLTQLMLGNQREYERSNKGELLEDKNSNSKDILEYATKDADASFLNQKRVLEHTFASLVYNDKRDIKSTKNKVYTKAEKREKAMYEEQLKWIDGEVANGNIKQPEAIAFKKKLNGYIDALGAYGDTEKWVDLPIKYTQMVGMGWNLMGGISNMTFGTAANFIEAAGEEFYTSSELLDAYGKVTHSMARNLSFNSFTTTEARKIRSLMDTYDIMAESGKEYKDLIGEDITERLKVLAAFNANQRTEYVNQAPLMIVMMKRAKFTHNGEEYSLYDGFNADGSWNDEVYGEYPSDLVNNAVLKTKSLIQRNHGNYNPLAPMLAKRAGVGRLLLQFRGWMVEGYKVRLGNRNGRPDYILESEVKGRYWSLIDSYKKQNALTVTKALLLQVLRNFVPFRNSIGLNGSPIEAFLNDGAVKPVDIANMKRLAFELNLLIGALAAGAILKYLVGEIDDEDDVRTKGLYLLLNQATRLQTDMMMYANPVEASKIIKDPVPAIRIMSNAVKVISAFHDTIIDGEPDFENGIHEGNNKIFTRMMEGIPAGRAAMSVISNTSQAY